MLSRGNIAQFDTGSPSEIGVQAQHVDCEGNFVSHALSRPMPTTEQLKVLDCVVLPVPVDVMNRLFWKQVASEKLRHHVAMLKNLMFFAGNQSRDRKPDVATAFDVPMNLAVSKAGKGFSFLTSRFAVLAAKLLLRVEFGMSSRSLIPAASDFSSAFSADEGLGPLSTSASRHPGACLRAIHWIAVIPISVRGQVRRGSIKLACTLLASKCSHLGCHFLHKFGDFSIGTCGENVEIIRT